MIINEAHIFLQLAGVKRSTFPFLWAPRGILKCSMGCEGHPLHLFRAHTYDSTMLGKCSLLFFRYCLATIKETSAVKCMFARYLTRQGNTRKKYLCKPEFDYFNPFPITATTEGRVTAWWEAVKLPFCYDSVHNNGTDCDVLKCLQNITLSVLSWLKDVLCLPKLFKRKHSSERKISIETQRFKK